MSDNVYFMSDNFGLAFLSLLRELMDFQNMGHHFLITEADFRQTDDHLSAYKAILSCPKCYRHYRVAWSPGVLLHDMALPWEECTNDYGDIYPAYKERLT